MGKSDVLTKAVNVGQLTTVALTLATMLAGGWLSLHDRAQMNSQRILVLEGVVAETRIAVQDLRSNDGRQSERLARIEAKIDLLLGQRGGSR